MFSTFVTSSPSLQRWSPISLPCEEVMLKGKIPEAIYVKWNLSEKRRTKQNIICKSVCSQNSRLMWSDSIYRETEVRHKLTDCTSGHQPTSVGYTVISWWLVGPPATNWNSVTVFLVFFAVLRIENMTSYFLGKCSTIWMTSLVLFKKLFIYFEIGSC
jgi:hypothetical protein